MPFVKQDFFVQDNTPAFLYIMRQFGMTQGEAQRLIDRKRLLVHGHPMTDKSARIQGEIQVVHFVPKSQALLPIYVAPHFLVFDKPSGILVHPSKTQSPYTLLDEIRAHSGPHANAVHRIDQETSGLVLASRNKHAETYLKNSFEQHAIRKTYLAWVHGLVSEHFEVEAPIRVNQDYRHTKHKVLIDFEHGKRAKTMFEVLEYDVEHNATLLRCRPFSGRTHQIRIHLFHVKHPILGDPIYTTSFDVATDYLEAKLSGKDRCYYTGAERLMLHAQSLDFRFGHRYFIESQFDFKGIKNMISRTRTIIVAK